jgi:shikimate kinase
MTAGFRAPLLVLIGFMGAGKSTLARMLAAELACPLADLDEEIARIHGPIPELFTARGESGFRALEHHQLTGLLATLPRPAVLALGGGAFLQPANRQLLDRHSATVIFLDAPFDVLHERIRSTAHERPLAADPERLRRLYELRRPTYLLAHHTIDTSSGDPAALLISLVQLANRIGIAAPTGG